MRKHTPRAPLKVVEFPRAYKGRLSQNQQQMADLLRQLADLEARVTVLENKP